MATEYKKIIIKKGLQADTPALSEGELGLQTDTGKVLIGTAAGNRVLADSEHTHKKADITDFPAAMPPTAHTHDYSTITNKPTTYSPVIGPYANQAVAGNDARLTNSRPASDVYPWAKNEVKPSYIHSEVGASPLEHAHGQITKEGRIGSSSGLLIQTSLYGELVAKPSGTINQFMRGDGQWITPSGLGSTEWTFLKKISTGNGSEAFSVDGTALGEAFDFDNFDYKFVYDGQTTNEGNSSPYIRFNNDSAAGRHAFTYDRTLQSQEGAPTQTLHGSMDTTYIQTGVMLGTATSDSVGVTLLTIEFIVTKARVASAPYNFLNFHLEGRGTATAGTGNTIPPTSSLIAIGRSSFSGNYEMASLGTPVTSIYFWHGITDGATDINVLRIYRRDK